MGLGVISFLPFNALSKIKDIVISFSTGNDDENQVIMRRVAGIDVVANVSFLITTTMGDTLVWDDKNIVDSLDAYTNFFFGNIEEIIDGDEVESDGKGSRQLGNGVGSRAPFGTNARGELTVRQQRMMGNVLPYSDDHVARKLECAEISSVSRLGKR